ncbi:MAG: hypothetical protein DRP47_10190 [Candidatus Zixiibacteriota bacterium]|nr:MAG: hypothetical protein DRP47_10190 [candidate division Zixibacteria bacterium]
MKKNNYFRMVIPILLLTGFIITGWTSLVAAKENPLLVKLPAEISAGMEKIYAIGEQSDRVVEAKEAQIQHVIDQIQASDNQRETFALQKEYLALRAEVLLAQASRIVSIKSELAKVVQKLDLLERLHKDSQKYGLGHGIDKDDPKSKQAVQSMLSGFTSIVKMIEKINPGANLGNQKDSIIINTNMANSFFSMDDNSSLEMQKRFFKDTMVLAQSVQGVLGLEHDHLMQKLYFVDAKNIVQQFGDLKVAIFGKGINVTEGFNHWHEMDDQALGTGQIGLAIGDGSSHPGWDQAGIIR